MTDTNVEDEMRGRLDLFFHLVDQCSLSRRDAARLVGVSAQTVQNWAAGHHLPRGYAEMKQLEKVIDLLQSVPDEERAKLKTFAARQVWLDRVTA